ncbi:hypothetical protein WA538_001788, partial [Blastocystis sp. DL]
MLGYGNGSAALQKDDGLSIKSQNEEEVPANAVEETDGVSPLPNGRDQTPNDNEDSIFDMISMVSSDAANAHSSQPRDESVHPLPPVSKDQKSPSTRSLMYKTSTGAEDLSSTLLDAIAPTLSESSHLPSSEEDPIPAIPASPPKPAKPTKPALKLVKPAETPAKSGLKPAMKPRPAGKSEPAKSPAESPKPVKLLVKPPTKPSKPVTSSTKLPPTQSVKLPPIETPANIVPANSSLPANVVPAKTPIPAKSSIPAGEAVTVEMVQEMIKASNRRLLEEIRTSLSATVSLQQKLRTDTESQLSRFQQQLRGELERFRSETESEVKKHLGVMSGCASQLRAAGEASQASLQAAVERTVQRAVREEVAPRLQAMVEELRGSVEAYVASFRVNSGELREVREMVEEMKKMLEEGEREEEEETVTEGEIDTLVAEGRVGELILRLGNAKEHPLLLYAMEQIVENNVDLTDGVEPGLLITLAYMIVVDLGDNTTKRINYLQLVIMSFVYDCDVNSEEVVVKDSCLSLIREIINYLEVFIDQSGATLAMGDKKRILRIVRKLRTIVSE